MYTTSQYLAQLIQQYEHVHPDIKIITIPKLQTDKVLIQTKYGLCEGVFCKLKKSKNITSRIAINKREFISNQILENYPNVKILNNVCSVSDIAIIEHNGKQYQYTVGALINNKKVSFAPYSLVDKQQWFIEQAIKIHGCKYDYSHTMFQNTNKMIDVTCHIHGLFKIRASAHIHQGQGCKKCALEQLSTSKTHTNDEFIKKSISVHGDTYDYSQCYYTGNRKEVSIICKKHGIFKQKPSVHMQGSGCPKCTKYTCNNLYLLHCSETGLFKIGICKNNVNSRISRIYHNSNTPQRTIQCLKVWCNKHLYEKKIHIMLKQYQECHPFYSDGKSEWFCLNKSNNEVINIISKIIDSIKI